MKRTVYNYYHLQERIDLLIGKFGLQKTIEVISSLSNNASLKTKNSDKLKLLFVFVRLQSIRVFDLQEDGFYTSNIEEYRQARMICYYLLKKYTNSSYAKIGEHFKQSKRAVLYNYQKCEEMLSIPQFYKPFIERFNILENNTINFITKLK